MPHFASEKNLMYNSDFWPAFHLQTAIWALAHTHTHAKNQTHNSGLVLVVVAFSHCFIRLLHFSFYFASIFFSSYVCGVRVRGLNYVISMRANMTDVERIRERQGQEKLRKKSI